MVFPVYRCKFFHNSFLLFCHCEFVWNYNAQQLRQLIYDNHFFISSFIYSLFRCDLSGFVFGVLNILLLCFSAPLPSSILMLAKYIIVTPFLIIYKPYFSVTLAKSNAKALLTLTHHKCPCDLRYFEKSVSIASIITQRLKYRHIDAPILLSTMILFYLNAFVQTCIQCYSRLITQNEVHSNYDSIHLE